MLPADVVDVRALGAHRAVDVTRTVRRPRSGLRRRRRHGGWRDVDRSYDTVRPGGRLVTLQAPPSARARCVGRDRGHLLHRPPRPRRPHPHRPHGSRRRHRGAHRGRVPPRAGARRLRERRHPAPSAGQDRRRCPTRDRGVSMSATEGHARGGFGLPSASALVVGSVIGTGVFALPSALASFGPISLVAFVLVTVGAIALALTFRSLNARLPGSGGPTSTRGTRSVSSRGSSTPGATGSPRGRQRRDRGGLGRLRRGLLEHRPQRRGRW